MIIVTGASRGIGLYLIQKFNEEKNETVGLYNNTLPPSHIREMYKVDITNLTQIKEFVDRRETTLNEVILINCAGANYNIFAHKANPQRWADIININLIGTFNMINAFLPIMRRQNYGRIINFSSVVAQIGVPGTSAYAASKSGLWGMSKAISSENSTNGLRSIILTSGILKSV